VLKLKRKHIAEIAGFPPTEQSVRILSKVRRTDRTADTIQILKNAVNHSDKFRKLLSHMPFLTADIISIFKPEYERYLNGRLLLSLLNGYEWNKNPLMCFDIVKDAVEAMIETVNIAELSGFPSEKIHFRSIVEIFDLNCRVSERYRQMDILQNKKPFPLKKLEKIKMINAEQISNSADLFTEGERMRHCAFKFENKILARKAVCLRVPDPELTILICRVSAKYWKITEVRGFANKQVRKSIIKKISAVIDNVFNRGTMILDLSFLKGSGKVFLG
jgi:hypothetical protein